MMTSLRQVAGTPYAVIGIVLVLLAITSVTLETQSNLIPPGTKFAWQVISGTALFGTMCYQWWFLRLRWLGKMTRRDLIWHRWSGVAAIALFVAHAVRAGHVWMTSVTVLFLLIALTGILNKEVMRYQSRPAYLVWLGLHLSLSVAIVPFILVHIWVALAY